MKILHNFLSKFHIFSKLFIAVIYSFIKHYSKSHVSSDYLFYKEDNKINREISVSPPHFTTNLFCPPHGVQLISPMGFRGTDFRSTCIYCAHTIFTLECKRSSSSPSCCGAYAYSRLDISQYFVETIESARAVRLMCTNT